MKASQTTDTKQLRMAVRKFRCDAADAFKRVLAEHGRANPLEFADRYLDDHADEVGVVSRILLREQIVEGITGSVRQVLSRSMLDEQYLPDIFEQLPVAIPDGRGEYVTLTSATDAEIESAIEDHLMQVEGHQGKVERLRNFQAWRTTQGIKKSESYRRFVERGGIVPPS